MATSRFEAHCVVMDYQVQNIDREDGSVSPGFGIGSVTVARQSLELDADDRCWSLCYDPEDLVEMLVPQGVVGVGGGISPARGRPETRRGRRLHPPRTRPAAHLAAERQTDRSRRRAHPPQSLHPPASWWGEAPTAQGPSPELATQGQPPEGLMSCREEVSVRQVERIGRCAPAPGQAMRPQRCVPLSH